MKYKLLFFISLISILSWQCQRKPYTPENLPDLQLRFGDGGGFTGAVTTFTLLTNGQLFKHNSFDNTHLQISQLPAKEAKTLYAEAEALKLDQLKVNKPGNIYYFITLHKDKSEFTYKWGDPEFTADPKIQAFYNKLHTLVQQAPPITK